MENQLQKITQVKMEKNQVIVTNVARTRDVKTWGVHNVAEEENAHTRTHILSFQRISPCSTTSAYS